MKFVFPKSKEEWVHKGEHFFHMAYLGMVTVEGHGYYRIAAAMLFCCAGAGVFISRDAVAHGEHAKSDGAVDEGSEEGEGGAQ